MSTTENTNNMPDLTLVQKLSALVVGIPAIAAFLSSFGIFDLSDQQVSSLKDLLLIVVIPVTVAIVSDFGIRKSRNDRLAKENAAAASGTTINNTFESPQAPDPVELAAVLNNEVLSAPIRQDYSPGS